MKKSEIGQLNHVEIYVSNLEKSNEFWQWLLKDLGYKKYQEWNEGVSFKLDKAYIVFVQTEEKYMKFQYHRKRIGLNHVAFSINKKLMGKIKKELSEKDIPLLYQNKKVSKNTIYFEDPDRIKVELVVPND